MSLSSAALTVVLLIISNVFMTFAWYGHLKRKQSTLWLAILISWMLAFFEYVFQVPANRIGSNVFSITQLKILQECITLSVFTVIAYLMFGETLKWNSLVAYLFIIAAVLFAFWDKL
ncbi:MAG: DMT family protein [Pyrinomonadaceae bacterium]|nr:DMT family protein [Pyrinomonadaceae bacterium]MCX7639698.1 DMT family protein [Pyrinomonadaceae bacterium]MDW8304600.1 DMT family protein [Acidobacteriota bacterium]